MHARALSPTLPASPPGYSLSVAKLGETEALNTAEQLNSSAAYMKDETKDGHFGTRVST